MVHKHLDLRLFGSIQFGAKLPRTFRHQCLEYTPKCLETDRTHEILPNILDSIFDSTVTADRCVS